MPTYSSSGIVDRSADGKCSPSWKDIGLISGQLRVEQTIYRGTTSLPRPRAADVYCRYLNLFSGPCSIRRAALGEFRPRPCVLDEQGHRPQRYQPASQRAEACRQIGTPWLGWHTLRRTHATLLQVAGGSLKDAQAQLRTHETSTTLEIYTVPIPAHQRAAVGKPGAFW